MENNKKIQVALFQWCISDYRLGIFKALQRRGDMVFTICAPDNPSSKCFLNVQHKEKEFPFIDIKCYRFKVPLINKIITFQPFAVSSVIRRRFDVIIMPNDFSDICVWINLLICRLFGCKICLWGQGESRRYRIPSQFFRALLMRLAHAVIFYTEGVRDKWIERGFRKDKLFVAYNALDTETASAIRERMTEKALESFRKERGLKTKNVVLYSGRLLPNKKPDLLVRALKKAASQIPDLQAVIIGEGPMRKQLEQLIEELGVGDIVTLTGAIYDEETMAKFFLSSRAMVIPAGVGLAVMHAFSYGLPVITGDNMRTHNPEAEILVDGVTGIYCKDGDEESFADAICCLLTDEHLYERLSKNAFEVIEKKHNMANMAAGFFDAVSYCMR